MYQFNATIPIILASTSPRRRELLDQVAVPHTCAAVNIDETRRAEEAAVDYIGRMVSQKAQAALQVLPNALTECVVITADTIGVLSDGAVLQKPNDFADACAMWRQMSNVSHQVWTAVQVSRMAQRGGQWQMDYAERTVVKTDVKFIALTDSMMTHYWHTGEPQDKAGGYAIQGLGAAWVKAIDGSYSNVVGLPLVETLDLLSQAMQTHQ
nr:Maf family protein [uncultured Moraxella sp.]